MARIKKEKNRNPERVDIRLEKLNERLKKWVTPKRLSVFFTVVYIVSLIPLLWIGWYNYPSADDYTIGNNSRQAWVSSHNIFKVLGAGIARGIEDWLEWMGYFTSNILMAIPPNSFHERLYVITVWVMLAMLSFSTVYLLQTIFVKVFRADKYTGRCAAVAMLFVTVQCMVGRVEAFYWYSGAANYMFVHGMSLFFYGLLISAVYDKGKKRAVKLAGASFLGFFTGGGNQLTALNVAIIMVVAILLISYRKKWREYRAFAIPIGLFFLGFVLNVAAPGNWVRAEGISGMNPIKAVMVSFYYCLDYCLGEWFSWPVLVLVVLLIPLFWHMAGETKFRFPCPLVVTLFGYCVVSAMMTPPLFAVGNIGAARLQALTFTMFILTLTLCVGYAVGWLKKKTEVKKEEGFSINEIWCLMGGILFFAFGAILTVIPEPHYFTFSSAVTDLADGSAKAYGDALGERLELYRSGEKNIIVEPLPSQPELLYFSDIKEDSEDWENKGVCRFYGLESVKVRGK
ncbi:MAG: DUF6056 family protein [Clostridium sp.]|nr:DUF6056 family protein [Clostridium sp.]